MSDTDDTPLERTDQATNAELVPDPRSEREDGGTGETGGKAADEVERLEGHTRRATEPEEPAAPSPHPD